jgi:predicted Zn-dependent protease
MRRLLFASLLLAGSAFAQTTEKQGVEVSKSRFLLLPASTVDRAAAGQYSELMRAAAQKGALNTDKREVERLRRIARALIPQSTRFNKEAERWRWEVNLLSSKQLNAFCMPGGKIAFFSGILTELKLDDDEVAVIMGHEIAHALLEHGRARMSEQVAKSVGISLAAAFFNLSNVSASLLSQAADLAVTLPHSRGHETDADLAGMELAARAGYDPRAALRVWQKMEQYAKKAGAGQPPQFLSTHPSHGTRISSIQGALPKVLPLYKPRGSPAGNPG